ncbi:MAG: OsmC family protein [Flavobacteriales bacterium]
MSVEIVLKNEAFHFEGHGENGALINIDGSKKIGGQDKGPTPMELLLLGAAGCSSIDVLSMLRKQRQNIENFKVTVDYKRIPNGEASQFKTITLNFHIQGDVDPKKAKRAINLSFEKYCSVSIILSHTATIDYTLIINHKIFNQ